MNVLILKIQKEKKEREREGSSHRGAVETKPTRNQEVSGSISGLAPWVKDLVLP